MCVCVCVCVCTHVCEHVFVSDKEAERRTRMKHTRTCGNTTRIKLQAQQACICAWGTHHNCCAVRFEESSLAAIASLDMLQHLQPAGVCAHEYVCVCECVCSQSMPCLTAYPQNKQLTHKLTNINPTQVQQQQQQQ